MAYELYDFNFNKDVWAGWGPEQCGDRYAEADREYDLFVGSGEITEIIPASIAPYSSEKSRRLWKATRSILGKDTENYPQQEGSCVAFGAKNAGEYLQCVEILAGDREKFHNLFPPYMYGTGRVYVGGGRIPGDGSFGNWQMVACAKYGFLRSDENGVPEYPRGRPANPTLGQVWGKDDRIWKKFVDTADDHTVTDKPRLRSLEGLCRMLVAGYPCTIASDQGFTMQPDSRGLHRPSGTWYHQMTFIGCIHHNGKTYFVILNSWGDVHGEVRDPETGEVLPKGVLLVEADRSIERMVASGECYPYSNFQGFPDNSDPLDKVEYDLF